jgi:glycine/D-amino acid oxidase-like deaminating enzyme
MSHVVIIGGGVVGATIAYELSRVPEFQITVIDRQPPAQASTGAALGVLMGVISQKIKGQAWERRQNSIKRYEKLIPELEAITGRKIPFNRQGIVSLLTEPQNLTGWENLAKVRQSQGWNLQLWDTDKLKFFCPQVDTAKITGAVYSPQDRQLNPTTLTLALLEAAQYNGVRLKFGVNVLGFSSADNCTVVETTQDKITADWVVVSAGLGSTPLTAQLNQKLDIRPVIGQALQVRVNQPLGSPQFQPVLTGKDVHIVPVGNGNYWVGATVEFPSDHQEILPEEELLHEVWQQAIAFCPDLATAEIIRTWSGLRPRPEGRPAPVIEKLPGFSHVLLATGHYRNGVLLAPATADAIREMIISHDDKK